MQLALDWIGVVFLVTQEGETQRQQKEQGCINYFILTKITQDDIQKYWIAKVKV